MGNVDEVIELMLILEENFLMKSSKKKYYDEKISFRPGHLSSYFIFPWIIFQYIFLRELYYIEKH